MPIACLGLSHRTAPVEVRERHAFPASRMAEALAALRDYEYVREAVMLQTCGRLEFYVELDDYEAGVAQLKSFLLNFRHGALEYDLESYLYTHLGSAAVEHLLRVSTGLDSMLIGEAEILGQVKDAYVQAQRAKTIGTTLHRLFRDALRAGKTARSTTRIGGESLSLATAAIEAAKVQRGTLAGACVVIAGAGKMGRTALRRLRDEGARRVVVANRTLHNARELVETLGFGEAVEMPALPDVLRDADVLLASTGATEFILSRDDVADVMACRPSQPLLVVDLAVPRDVDPEVGTLPNVALLDVDGLRPVIDERLDVRREAIPEVERIITSYAERFLRWYRSQLAVPAIALLTQKAEAIRIAELERLFARCPELTERERMLVTGMSMTIVSKLLHSAIANIREKATAQEAEVLSHVRVLDELFELNLAERIAELQS
ncbi:MAG TPA: glutamyl-tRNA reductase [Candidatus Tyrphobacter sp.]